MFLKLIFTFLLSFSLAYAQSTPEISANILILNRDSNFHRGDKDATSLDPKPNGLDIQEVEVNFHSHLNSQTRMDLFLSIAPEYVSDGTTVSQEFHVEPEEAYIESDVTETITLKLGKFKASMGKHNRLHSHDFSFVHAPQANINLMGGEGLTDIGASSTFTLPSSWSQEITLQYFRGKGENDSFNSPSPSMGVGLINWSHLWDLGLVDTFELGLSYANGANSYRGETRLSAADLTYSRYLNKEQREILFQWTFEYLTRLQAQKNVNDENGLGYATWGQYQFADDWSVRVRFDTFKMKDSLDLTKLPNDTAEQGSIGFVYSTNPFSYYRIEANRRHGGALGPNGETTETSVFLQASFTLGSADKHSH